jgi:hypothetical protein
MPTSKTEPEEGLTVNTAHFPDAHLRIEEEGITLTFCSHKKGNWGGRGGGGFSQAMRPSLETAFTASPYNFVAVNTCNEI